MPLALVSIRARPSRGARPGRPVQDGDVARSFNPRAPLTGRATSARNPCHAASAVSIRARPSRGARRRRSQPVGDVFGFQSARAPHGARDSPAKHARAVSIGFNPRAPLTGRATGAAPRHRATDGSFNPRAPLTGRATPHRRDPRALSAVSIRARPSRGARQPTTSNGLASMPFQSARAPHGARDDRHRRHHSGSAGFNPRAPLTGRATAGCAAKHQPERVSIRARPSRGARPATASASRSMPVFQSARAPHGARDAGRATPRQQGRVCPVCANPLRHAHQRLRLHALRTGRRGTRPSANPACGRLPSGFARARIAARPVTAPAGRRSRRP